MGNFKELSVETGISVDQDTGEVSEIGFREQQHGGKYIVSSYDQTAIDIVRSVTSPLGEKLLCNVTGGRRVKKGNNQGFDILLPNGSSMEAKIGRIGNSAVIKRNQLDYLGEEDYYGIVYYRTTENKPPSFFTSQETKIGPVANLRRNISLQAVFILPQPLMVYYYNESDLVEGKISTTGIYHKPMAFSRAMDLFESDIDSFQRRTSDILYGRHAIQVFSAGYII